MATASSKIDDGVDAFWLFSRSEKNAPVASATLKPSDDYYNMRHAKRGTAVIFNHMYFENLESSTRDGTNKDRDDLEEMLIKFDFNVEIYNDLNFREIVKVLQNVSQMDHTHSDCLMVVVMSHGNNGTLFAKDRQYSTTALWEPFTGKNCPTLVSKPKLFFIQACRGTNFDSGVKVTYTSEVDSKLTNKFYTLPTMADILVMYSSVDGYYAWRNPISGSYFIQSLVQQLSTYGYEKDLLTILTLINRQVAIEFCSYEEDPQNLNDYKQMCTIVSMLTRIFKFEKA